jgi:hypothetical protein
MEAMMPESLTDKLVQAAETAIRNEAKAFSYEPGRVKGLTLDLAVSHNGGVVAGDLYIQRAGKTLRRED